MAENYRSVTLNTPRVEHKPSTLLAGIRARHEFAGFDFEEFPRQVKRMTDGLDELEGRMGDQTYDVFWRMFGPGDGAFDYLAGVRVSANAVLPQSYTTLELPEQSYLVVANREGDDPRDAIHTLWFEWLPSSPHRLADDQPEFLYEEHGGQLEIWIPIDDPADDNS
jgi:AraC family transcriptional regulator